MMGRFGYNELTGECSYLDEGVEFFCVLTESSNADGAGGVGDFHSHVGARRGAL